MFVTNFPTSTQHSAEHSRKSVCEEVNVFAITHSLDLVANLISYIWSIKSPTAGLEHIFGGIYVFKILKGMAVAP